MSQYKITCCSTCDLKAEQLEELGVAYAPYHYIVNGVDNLDDLFASRTPKEFYDEIDGGAMPTTSQVTPDELIRLWKPVLDEGCDILHIEFSSGLSGGFESAKIAKAEMEMEYPKRKLIIVDSLAASSGYGLLVDKAVSLKNGGMGIDELAAWLEENKLRLRHWFFTTNLQHFKRGGRISGTSATIGSLLKICPVMEVNSEGKLVVRKKALGKKKAIKEMLAFACEQAEGGKNYNQKCYISNSRVLDDARTLAEMIEAELPLLDGRVRINNIGPVIGSHTGPGCVALFFFSTSKREV